MTQTWDDIADWYADHLRNVGVLRCAAVGNPHLVPDGDGIRHRVGLGVRHRHGVRPPLSIPFVAPQEEE